MFVLLIVQMEGTNNFLINVPIALLRFCEPSLPQPAVSAAVHTGDRKFDLLVALNMSRGPRTFHFERANWLLTLYRPADEDELITTLEGISQEFNHDENAIAEKTGQHIHFICFPWLAGARESTSTQFLLGNGGKLASSQYSSGAIPISEQVYIATRPGGSSSLRILEVFSLNRSLTVLSEVPWRNQHISLSDVFGLTQQLAVRRGDLMGIRLKVAAVVDTEYVEAVNVVALPNGTTKFIGGIFLNVLFDLRDMLNFTYEPVKARGWIEAKIDNGTKLNNVGQQIMDYEADFCISNMIIKIMRLEMLHFLPQTQQRQAFLFFRDRSFLSSRKNVLKPFSPHLWVAIGATLGLILVMTYALSSTRHHALSEGVPRVQDVVIKMLSALFCQGWSSESIDGGLRTILLIAFAISHFLFSCYCAAFVAKLSIPNKIIHNYVDIKRHGYTAITHPVHTHNVQLFLPNPEEEVQVIQNSIKYYTHISDAARKVLLQKVAYAGSNLHFYRAALKEGISEAQLCEISDLISPGHLNEAIAMRKGSPLREIFGHSIVLLIERGLVRRYNKLYDQYSLVNCGVPGTIKRQRHVAVAAYECIVAFSIIFLGIGSSIVVLEMERISRQEFSRNRAYSV